VYQLSDTFSSGFITPLSFAAFLYKLYSLLVTSAISNSTKNFYRAISSALFRYGLSPGLVPWTTLPEIWSFTVVLGTLYSCAAQKIFIPPFTASIAEFIYCSVRSLFTRFITILASADLLQGLPRGLLLHLPNVEISHRAML